MSLLPPRSTRAYTLFPSTTLCRSVLGGPDGTAAAAEQVSGSLAPGEGLLLCSDGLTSEVGDEEIARVLNGNIAASGQGQAAAEQRSEEQTSELQSLMRISYAGLCLKKKT